MKRWEDALLRLVHPAANDAQCETVTISDFSEAVSALAQALIANVAARQGIFFDYPMACGIVMCAIEEEAFSLAISPDNLVFADMFPGRGEDSLIWRIHRGRKIVNITCDWADVLVESGLIDEADLPLPHVDVEAEDESDGSTNRS